MKYDFVRLLAAWALVHETADESWKASVARGKSTGQGGMEGGPDAFVDGLAAMVAEEKERLKSSLLSEGVSSEDSEGESVTMEDLKFEIGQIRARLEAMETALDAVLRHLGSVDKRQPSPPVTQAAKK